MKILKLAAFSFCVITNSNCNDNQESSICNQPASAVLAGFSGSARPATKYDVNWQGAFKQESTRLINLFSQFKQAVSANDSINVSKMLKLMNDQFEEMEINDPRYLSFLADNYDLDPIYTNTPLPKDFFENNPENRIFKSRIGDSIMGNIYQLLVAKPKLFHTYSLYETRNENFSQEIADALEYLFCILAVAKYRSYNPVGSENIGRRTRLESSFTEIINLEQSLKKGECDYDIIRLENEIKRIETTLTNTKNPLINQRVGKVLNLLRQKVSEQTRQDKTTT